MAALIEFVPRLDGAGTPESTWAASTSADLLPRWHPMPDGSGRVVVVAPHPDDEVLGVGGTVARLAASGAHHVAVAVTDGESSHPGQSERLRHVRRHESRAAAARLGIIPDVLFRLAMPDGGVDAGALAPVLARLIEPGDLVLAPWVSDGHPDHAQVGLGAEMACAMSGGRLLAYLVWAWHWARPDQLPWHKAVRVDLDPALVKCKRDAVACFSSQLEGPRPILTPETVVRLTRGFEVLLTP